METHHYPSDITDGVAFRFNDLNAVMTLSGDGETRGRRPSTKTSP